MSDYKQDELEIRNSFSDMEKRITLLEVNWNRYEEHHSEIKQTLAKIWDKLITIPCDKHLGERNVLESRVTGLNKKVDDNFSIAWTVLGIVLAAITGLAFMSFKR
jgi:hypothetical protein